MPYREVLIMAVTRMLSGVCIAGFSTERHPMSQLCWVRPVKEHGTLLLGDITYSDKRVMQPGDIVELNLLRPRPKPPHVEDWVTDFIYQRPRLARRLESERRGRWLATHLDRSPKDITAQSSRSLCLVKPARIWASFSLDAFSGKYQTRMGFTLPGVEHAEANAPRGVPVTDVKWRALGRAWLGKEGGELALAQDELQKKLGAQEIYLALGLSRSYEGKIWLLVIGVHCVPDYEAEIDYDNL